MTGTCVNIAGVSLKNPVMTASGTFGSGMEYGEFFDLSALVRNAERDRSPESRN